MRKDPNRGPQNWQKYILQQKNVVAGKNLPYVVHMNIFSSYEHLSSYVVHMDILVHMAGSSQPQHFFAAGCLFADFVIALIYYPIKETL